MPEAAPLQGSVASSQELPTHQITDRYSNPTFALNSSISASISSAWPWTLVQ